MLKFRQLFMLASLAVGLSSAAVAETIFVTNTNDSGAGSLRQAINDANANVSLTTILINIPGALGTDRIINVPTALPSFTTPVELRIDGAQTGKAVLKAPIINGPGAATTGLTFAAGSANSKVEFLSFRDFVFSIVLNAGVITINNNRFENNQGGIDIRPLASGGNTIKGNVFTTTNTGASAFAGVSAGNTIQGNGFTGEGINLSGGGNIIGGLGNADPNTFTNTPGASINLENGSGAIIQHNTINGSKGAGITVTGIDISILSNNLSNNVGWDITVGGNGHSHKIGDNQIIGDNGIFNGILLTSGSSYTVYNNTVSGGSIELQDLSSNSWYGPLSVTNNVIVNDPQGVSGHGALSLTNTTNARISGNEIHHNASNGIYLYNSTNNIILNNNIYENFRAGVNVGTSLYNKITRNVIRNNHADVNGGRTGIALTQKAAPTITSAKRVGSNFVITGTGTVANDTLEFFLSDRATRNATLAQNALSFQGAIKATGTTWTATLSAANYNSAEIYFIATATDVNATTSTFSKAVGVEINGPTAATTNYTSTYFAEYIPGATYSWWSTLPYSSVIQSGNQVSFNFNQVGTGTVSVGYTDPTTGAWKQYNLAVTVFGPAREGAADATPTVQSLAYPNPFVSTTQVTVEGTESISLQLFDDKGSLVYRSEGHAHGTSVELGNDLKAGIYTLKTISGGNIETTRIVKVQ
ncbi:MAG: right-handed parallel beta-helix repeat-containing protein [Cytophagaceae bacterium]|nr:right-handed parallel beta-helix repeat-containing protein [Cytophagaceae bacterium]